MPRGILPEVKLRAVKDYISGNGSYLSHASELGVGKTVLEDGLTSIKHSRIRFPQNRAQSILFGLL